MLSPRPSPRPETPSSVPCISCDCYLDLCPPEDHRMWCARFNKCLMVQGLILLVLIVHFTINAKVVYSTDLSQPQPSDHLCHHPACSCSLDDGTKQYHVYCNCTQFHHGTAKSLMLFTPLVINENTFVVHVSQCDVVDVFNHPNLKPALVVPTWFAITDVKRLNLHPESILVGKNVVLQDIGDIPQLPTGILRIASLSEQSPVETFRMQNTVVGAVQYKAFDSLQLKASFTIFNVTLKQVEEGAFNLTIPQGSFNLVGSLVWRLNSSVIQLKTKDVIIERTQFGLIYPRAITARAEHFRLDTNVFHEPVKRHAFDVQSQHVVMKQNTFSHLEEQAFFKIRDMPDKIGSYDFSMNYIYSVANGSLNPNRILSSNDNISLNALYNCSSTNIGWIWEAAYGPYVPQVTHAFYTQLLDINSNNICVGDSLHCPLDNTTQMYNPEDPDNWINKFANASNEKICHYLENSSFGLEPNVIIFMHMICFYIFAFLIRY